MSTKFPDRLIYYRGEAIQEDNVFELIFDGGPNIHEFKNYCVILANYLGYHNESITEAFNTTGSLLMTDFKIIQYNK
jgi:hypothetical protein